MKDYNKMFDEANKEALEQYKLWQWYWRYSSVITAIITVVLVLFLAKFRSIFSHIPVGGGTILFAMICLCIVSTIAKAKFDSYKKELEEKAKKFVSRTILNDLCSTLEGIGTLEPQFKLKFIDLLHTNHVWFKDGQFVCNGFALDYKKEKERLILKNEGCTYYLTSWWHSYGLTFMFAFDKINPNGRVEKDVKFSLETKEAMLQ